MPDLIGHLSPLIPGSDPGSLFLSEIMKKKTH